MASVGHIAVGLAAGRVHQPGRELRWASAVAWSALALLPDVDVIGFALGVDYADPWGHRGATHSLAFSCAFGLLIGLAARTFGLPALRTTLIVSVVLASHAILDTMTDGGLGCALFWPFDATRYFAPWRPIPVSPIGFDLLSPFAAIIALTELLLFAPLWVYALRPRIVTTARDRHPAGRAVVSFSVDDSLRRSDPRGHRWLFPSGGHGLRQRLL